MRAFPLLAALVLVVPPVPVSARTMIVDICGEPGVRIAMPIRLPMPKDGMGHGCCIKGCHAASDRKKRIATQSDGLGHGEDCC